MRISCLHASQFNIPIYEAAAPEGVALTHFVRSDLLYRARDGVDAGLKAEINIYLGRIAAGSDAVLMTCSRLAEWVELPAFSANALLAEAVAEVARGKSVDVFYTNLDSRTGIEAHFSNIPEAARVGLVPVPDARELLRAGDEAGHHRLVARAVKRSNADIIVLAQAPMYAAVSDDPRAMCVARVALGRLSMIQPAQ